MDGSDFWRLFNAALAFGSLIAMVLQMWRIWSVLSSRARLLTQAHAALLLAVVTGSIESMIQNNPTGVRTAITTAACAWTLFALLGTKHAFTKDEENRA